MIRCCCIAFSTLLFILSSCSSPVRVLDYWTSEDFRDYSKKSFVVAVKADDPANRQLFEDRIADKMDNGRIEAITSYTVLPDQVITNLDEFLNSNQSLLDSLGIRGVVFAAVKNVIISDKPGEQASEKQKQDPENSPLSRTYVLESRIIDLKRSPDNQLVGVNLVSITDPTSADKLVSRYSKVVSKHFKKSPSNE
ncbi:hypothetical protein [Aureitalea marina]|uniref:hypothetical protein n=1 Tax=Aureitalea marina TaxID=930804 RepID=UPI0011B0A15F|nr:hypothetical protein [Aureitalea marina]